ncbi:MAG TPA: hypothetical protein VH479_11540 [Acidimicrobiales bacterium]|jgi:hypothetical protein
MASSPGPSPAAPTKIRATGFTPSNDGDLADDGVEREDDLWHRYRQARVWVTARNRKRSTYVTRDEAPTGAAVMRF